jgi:hypothetical protein
MGDCAPPTQNPSPANAATNGTNASHQIFICAPFFGVIQ